MGDNLAGQNTNVFLLSGITIVLCLIMHFAYKLIFGNKKNEALQHEVDNKPAPPVEAASEPAAADTRASGKSKKRTPWKGGKTEFNHPWLLKNLKGHPGNVLLVDFSANGKFLAAACDETVVAAMPPVAPPAPAPAHRPQKAQRKGRHHQATASSPPSPQRIPAEEFVAELQQLCLSPCTLWSMGYPVELTNGKASFYVDPPPRPAPSHMTQLDVNAPAFVPGSQADSGRGSWGSSPRSDSDEEADIVEHSCCRCDTIFKMTREGDYISNNECLYHWGKITGGQNYSCCKGAYGTRGCTTGKRHVWSGYHAGMNGPLDGFVRARSARGGAYAIDTEMCFTTAGLELASVVVISPDGKMIYKTAVQPSAPLVDCNTRFSGLRKRDIVTAPKSLKDVQNDILGFVGVDTILIGHALNNDLRALKLVHTRVVDTCQLFPHPRGLPLRRGLKQLAAEHLGRAVQCSSSGHSPYEDAVAALDLVLVKVKMLRDKRRYNPMYEPYDPLIGAA